MTRDGGGGGGGDDDGDCLKFFSFVCLFAQRLLLHRRQRQNFTFRFVSGYSGKLKRRRGEREVSNLFSSRRFD